MGGMYIKDRPRLAPRLAGTNFPKRRNFFPVGVGEEKRGGALVAKVTVYKMPTDNTFERDA